MVPLPLFINLWFWRIALICWPPSPQTNSFLFTNLLHNYWLEHERAKSFCICTVKHVCLGWSEADTEGGRLFSGCSNLISLSGCRPVLCRWENLLLTEWLIRNVELKKQPLQCPLDSGCVRNFYWLSVPCIYDIIVLFYEELYDWFDPVRSRKVNMVWLAADDWKLFCKNTTKCGKHLTLWLNVEAFFFLFSFFSSE